MRASRVAGVLMVLGGLALLGSSAASVVGVGADRSATRELRSVIGSPHATMVAVVRPRAAAAARGAAAEAQVVGQIRIPSARISSPLVLGDGPRSLRRGASIYQGSPFPGEGGTVAVAGHRTTYGAPFRNMGRVRAGDRVVVAMSYGKVRYRVERIEVVDPDDVGVIRRTSGSERLVLTTCHPLFSAERRLVVTARRA